MYEKINKNKRKGKPNEIKIKKIKKKENAIAYESGFLT